MTAVCVLKGHAYPVKCIAFSPDSKLLASASVDNTVRLWNVPSGELHSQLVGHTGTVFSVAFSPDGESIVTGGNDNTIRKWNLASKKQ